MKSVITIRVPKDDLEDINLLSKESKKDKSTVIRELIHLGKIYLAIEQYQEGKISIGKAAKLSDLSISETMDLFVKFGVKNNLTREDYLKGYRNIKARNIFGKKRAKI